jgi:hypothetical protein
VEEVIPPGRHHVITTTSQAEVLDERIQVGRRTWSRKGERWSELSTRQADLKVDRGSSMLLPPNLPLTCLGSIEFAGNTYVAFRGSHAVATIRTVAGQSPPKSDPPFEEVRRWQIVLLDPQTGLLAYQLVTAEKQLLNVPWAVRYTYPGDITIEPPAR